MAFTNQPKPDDRSDNAEKLQSMIADTEENIQKAEESMQFTDSAEQRQQIEAKNQRRRESIESFQAELQDET
ncbi:MULTISPECIES: small acid-soluble spore protein Tlp [Bacillaceae]|uniref:small acid-soluble spore protein Tlp n=1 Tax=Bacillaceae TaxID=186817 RepID=UPI00118C2832|nr:small acid-soluble spore protein Tlp [Bacillus sp. S3]QCJ42756.1 small acid-soluble spore protein Tlp [Bacillus sp. S3]